MLGEDIKIKIELNNRAGIGNVDPDQMEQLIMNIAVNARNAIPFGGILTIKTNNKEFSFHDTKAYAGSRKSGLVLLTISNAGVGMDSKTLS